MRTRRILIQVMVLAAVACGLAACSGWGIAPAKPPEIEPPPQSAPTQQPQQPQMPRQPQVLRQPQPPRQPQVSPLRSKVLALLEKQQYRTAIESMTGRYREGLEREYVLAINKQLELGNSAYSRGDYYTAAQTYKFVLNAYPGEPSLWQQISHDPNKIRSSMEHCLNQMMEQGIVEYRSGRLENAIVKWKDLLAINPDHQEAKKACDTATIQLQSLQNLNKKTK
jgi:tetratricopeptide (TPR) repeat protein